MSACLVVANRTLPSEELAEAIRERIDAGDRSFYVVVPLTPVSRGILVDEAESADAARDRLAAFVDALHEHGVEADGEIGDSDPIQAVRDVIRSRDFDQILLSTLPAGASRWLQRDVPTRLDRAVDVPIKVVTQEATAAATQR